MYGVIVGLLYYTWKLRQIIGEQDWTISELKKNYNEVKARCDNLKRVEADCIRLLENNNIQIRNLNNEIMGLRRMVK